MAEPPKFYNVDKNFMRSYERRNTAVATSLVAGIIGLGGVVAGGLSDSNLIAIISGGLVAASVIPTLVFRRGLRRDSNRYQNELNKFIDNEIYGLGEK